MSIQKIVTACVLLLMTATALVSAGSREPNVAQKGCLNFANADYVSGGDGRGIWYPSADDRSHYLQITIKSEAPGRRYLIDCAVAPYSPTENDAPYIIRNYGGDLLQTIESNGNQGQHLVFAFEAADSNWDSLRISRTAGWYLFSCEVTNF